VEVLSNITKTENDIYNNVYIS